MYPINIKCVRNSPVFQAALTYNSYESLKSQTFINCSNSPQSYHFRTKVSHRANNSIKSEVN